MELNDSINPAIVGFNLWNQTLAKASIVMYYKRYLLVLNESGLKPIRFLVLSNQLFVINVVCEILF
jgi:hypothetical protein